MRRGLPSAAEIPNDETRAAIEEARAAASLIEAEDVPQLLALLLAKRERTCDAAARRAGKRSTDV